MPGRTSKMDAPKENYTGHELDEETGLLYAGARLYDPVIARWGVVDRFADRYLDLSPYSYVAGVPTSFIDVNGDSIYVAGNEAERFIVNSMGVSQRFILCLNVALALAGVSSCSQRTSDEFRVTGKFVYLETHLFL